MVWIEIIRLRGAHGSDLGPLTESLHQSLECELGVELKSIRILRHASVETDLSIHLIYESETDPETALGARLVAELEAYGLSERSLWVETAKTMSSAKEAS